MAIKKRKKIKNKKVRVEKSSAPPPDQEQGDKPKSQEKTENSKSAEKSKKEEKASVKKNPVNKENTAVKEPSPKPKSKSKEQEGSSGGLASYIEFLKLTRIEFRKINWPDRRQIVQETWTVLILVTFITLLVLGYDWVLGNMVFGPLEHWIKMNL